ncbi:MAG: type-F conjugative transfer system secretin TraK [Sphingomonadaceae bacterium]|nr:type-F conjugative transfer system secretin TraK [Sphingomonadaceae bacterium]
MGQALCVAGVATGSVLMTRFDWGTKVLGTLVFAGSVLALSSPAYADQTLMASDNARIDCIASSRDLTRISLVGDEIASVSKLQTGNASEDFSVVNEPVRGDIYVSVPEGFSPKTLSFFATSKKGYVYKFACRLEGAEAQQVFVANPAIAGDKPDETHLAAVATTPEDQAVKLVQAMYSSAIPDGYRMRQPVRTPVRVGDLKVQEIAEYRGAALTGQVLRIENKGAHATTLGDSLIAPSNAVAVTVAEPTLAAGAVTTAYIVLPAKAGEQP